MDKLTSVLAMYGYSLLGCQKLATEQSAHLPVPADRPYVFAFIVQNLHPDIVETDGLPLNVNIFKAVKGVTRKLKDIDPYIVTPGNIQEHAALFDLMAFSDRNNLSDLAQSNSESFECPFPALECISDSNSRTRIDKIHFQGQTAVCKTFRHTNLVGLKNEINARRVLGKAIPEIVPILDHGDNYFIMPLFEPSWAWQDGDLSLFPLHYAEKCLDVMRRIHAEGWSVIDWHPGNFIYLPEGNVAMIDLEALTPNTSPTRFEESADILGHRNFPYQNKPINYENTWLPIIGLSLNSLLYGSSSKKRWMRGVYFICKALPVRLVKKLEQAFRKPIKKLVARKQIRRNGKFLVYRF